jgi:hypothetical protein
VTVIAEAESKNLTVLETVKTELGITGSENDVKLSDLICTASDIITDYCKRQFAEETVSEVFLPERGWRTGECVDCLVLARNPVSDIISVTDNSSALVATDFDLDADTGILYRVAGGSHYVWNMIGQIEVVYTGGYALLDGLPRSIERAAVLLVKDMFSAQGRDPRVKSESTPGIYTVDYWVGSVGPAGELPPDITALLGPYRRMIA